VDNTRDPTKNTQCDVDEEVSGATALYRDRYEGNPYREEVEEDSALAWKLGKKTREVKEDVTDCA
jgi:hypothetical protein